MNLKSILTITLVTVFSFSTAYAEKPVAISKSDGPYSLEIGVSVDVGEHKIMRNQNNKNTVNPSFAKTLAIDEPRLSPAPIINATLFVISKEL